MDRHRDAFFLATKTDQSIFEGGKSRSHSTGQAFARYRQLIERAYAHEMVIPFGASDAPAISR
jgi:hypothetical protein